jgi:large subunit ribosomal protein L6
MSRIGKQPIEIPDKTSVTVSDGIIAVLGPGGELRRRLHGDVSVAVENGVVTVSPARETQLSQALWGTYASLIRSMVVGVNEPFVKKLQVEGIGYRVETSGDTLKLSVGFSHPVELKIPEGISVAVEKNIITVSGINKEQVGQFAADVRAVKKPEPYKGKGIRYEGEIVRRKQGKKGAA